MSVIRGNTTTTPMKRPDIDQAYNPKSSNPQSGIAVEQAINSIGLVAMWSMEPPTPIADIKPGYENAFGVEYFNRYPNVGDKFFCYGISSDEVSFHMTAQVTGYANRTDGGKNASFKVLEVIACSGSGATKIKTINGQQLRFFVGTKEEYDELTDKDNLFAIFTNDTAKEEIMSKLEELAEGIVELNNADELLRAEFLKKADLSDAIENLQNNEEWVSFTFGNYCFEVGKTYCVRINYGSDTFQFMFHVSNEGGAWLPTAYTSAGFHTEILLSENAGSYRLYGYIVSESENYRLNLNENAHSVKAKYRIIR